MDQKKQDDQVRGPFRATIKIDEKLEKLSKIPWVDLKNDKADEYLDKAITTCLKNGNFAVEMEDSVIGPSSNPIGIAISVDDIVKLGITKRKATDAFTPLLNEFSRYVVDDDASTLTLEFMGEGST